MISYVWALLRLLLDESLLFFLCIPSIVVGSKRSLAVALEEEKKIDGVEPTTLNSWMAVLAPFLGSASLVFFFYFFSSVQFFLVLTVVVMSGFAVAFSVYPLCAWLSQRLQFLSRRCAVPFFGSVGTSSLLSCLIMILVVISWVLSNNWILLDVLDVCTAILVLCYIRLPSLKVGTILLCGLLVYDIFWVFFSEYFFRRNVMVEVAQKEAANPVAVVAEKVGFAELAKDTPQLNLPGKFIIIGLVSGHVGMLGLGDVILPGVLLCFAMRFDYRLHQGGVRSGPCSYFFLGIVGYSFGLVMSLVMSVVYRVAQPALLYLVPSSLCPLLVLATMRHELSAIWNGSISQRMPHFTAFKSANDI